MSFSPKFLSATVMLVPLLTFGQMTPIPVTLTNGDAAVNNAVDLADLSELFVNFGQPPSPTNDLNGDGIVNTYDLTVVFLNFGAVGDDLP